ncbi:MAG: helix-hairpin-helix domain-containing protein [Myxococcota bacterium]
MTARASRNRNNAWLAAQLRELSARLDLDDVPHRPRAYRRAAETLEQLDRPARNILAAEGTRGLDALPGIGPHIAGLLRKLIETGKSGQLERLRKKKPIDVLGLLAVHGIGRKALRTLWEELGVENLDDLERAMAEQRVRTLPGFGPKREEQLRQAVRIQRRGNDRLPGKKALPIAEKLRAALERDPSVEKCSIAGSLRRGEPTVGDIDLVAASSDPAAIAARLLDRPEVDYVYSHGPQRVSVRVKPGVDVDLRTVNPRSFGSALLYFTGNRAHTVALRRLALAQGLRLNEYGLFRGPRRIAGETEREIYESLSLPYLAPELRRGESVIREALRKSRARSHP